MKRPLIELFLVVLTGIGHVAIELGSAAAGNDVAWLVSPQYLFNIVAAAGWGTYLISRLVRISGTPAEWGLARIANLPAWRACGLLAIVALVPLVVYGFAHGRVPFPASFWLIVGLYPLWGLAQQFALQVLVTRNLRPLVPRLFFRILLAAAIFSAAHFPNTPLMLLTLAGGIAFSWIFERYGNLWAVGVTHGIIGAVAYYAVLGQDPGAQILGLVARLHGV